MKTWCHHSFTDLLSEFVDFPCQVGRSICAATWVCFTSTSALTGSQHCQLQIHAATFSTASIKYTLSLTYIQHCQHQVHSVTYRYHIQHCQHQVHSVTDIIFSTGSIKYTLSLTDIIFSTASIKYTLSLTDIFSTGSIKNTYRHVQQLHHQLQEHVHIFSALATPSTCPDIFSSVRVKYTQIF